MSKGGLLTSKSLRLQIIIVFSLVSIIPILALLNYIFPSLFPKVNLDIVILTILAMAVLGFFLLKGIVDPIVEMNSDLKVIASGEVSRMLSVSRDDEIGELSQGVNQLTQRIKDQMDELKIYGERSKVINMQIKQHMAALSALVHISTQISGGAKLGEIFNIVIARLSQISSSSAAFLISKDGEDFNMCSHFGLGAESLEAVKAQENRQIFKRLLAFSPYLKIDALTGGSSFDDLLGILGVKNLLVFPVSVYKKNVALLGIGNNLAGFEYLDDDVEVIKVFAKQLAIALENNLLQSKVNDLEYRDIATGLYNKTYTTERFQEEIMRAIPHQRPCSFVLVRIQNFFEIKDKLDENEADEIAKKTADALLESVSFLDRVGRIEENEFGIILPEKNKRQAQELSEQIKDKVNRVFRIRDVKKRPQFNVAVVENPIDGSDSVSLIEKARSL